MKRITLLLSFFLFLTGIYATGQTKDNAPKSFSVKEAVDYALEHQKNVKNASLDARISDQQVKEIIGIGLPQVNGSVDLKDFWATLEHVLARTNPETDLYVFSNLSMDTLDYTGPAVNKGSKGVWLGLGDPVRELPRQFSAASCT